jgi:hypothetical protein
LIIEAAAEHFELHLQAAGIADTPDRRSGRGVERLKNESDH